MSKFLKPVVLVVEDDAAISSIIKYNLQKEGFSVYTTDDGKEALKVANSNKPDIILLDWMLPGLSGIEVCAQLRSSQETANIPVIMISARGEESDTIAGLEQGADDYLIKPFSHSELLARINAVFRRIRPAFYSKSIKFRDIEMDLVNFSVRRGTSSVKLARIEFQILQALMENPGRVLSREDLIDKIWKVGSDVSTRTVDVHVTRLRKALLDTSPDGVDIIKTVRLIGYSLKV